MPRPIVDIASTLPTEYDYQLMYLGTTKYFHHSAQPIRSNNTNKHDQRARRFRALSAGSINLLIQINEFLVLFASVVYQRNLFDFGFTIAS